MSADQPGLFPRVKISVLRRAVSLLLDSRWTCARLSIAYAAPIEGRVLDPQLGALLRLNEISGAPEVGDLLPNKARALLSEQLMAVDLPPPPGVRTEDRFLPGGSGPIGVRIYTPAGIEAPSPAVVYIHGGGWVIGSISTHESFCRRLALGARCRVVSVEYRLAPEHSYPAAVEDALASFRWVAAHAEELSIDPHRIAVAGDSAGGNLSAVVGLRTRGELRPPALQVLIYPAVDATCALPSHATYQKGYFLTRKSIDWYYGHYVGGAEHRRQPDVSPLLEPDVAGVPPALIYTAGFDPLRDEGQAYAERLEKAGVPVMYREYPTLVHGFVLMGNAVAAARRALLEIAAEVGEHIGQ
jgi:acetyl esterase